MAFEGSFVDMPLFGTHWVSEHVYNLGDHLVITIDWISNNLRVISS